MMPVSNKKKRTGRLRLFPSLLAGLLLAALLLPLGLSPAAAQVIDESWNLPVNLSNSGATSAPMLVVDSAGRFHAFWMDEVAGWAYSSGDGLQWSQPDEVSLPSDTDLPSALVADNDGNLLIFWLDDDINLYWSRAAAGEAGGGLSWSGPQMIAREVVAIDVSTDSAGNIHLAYVQSADEEGAPAGVYYRRNEPNRSDWSTPTMLYQSPYLRSLSPQEAHVQIDTAEVSGGQRVYVAWDNPSRERVFVTRSLDGGETWGAPEEVDSPVDGTVAGGPYGITVGADGLNVLLVWRTQQSGPNCIQYSQWSFDGGDTWEERQQLLENLPGCAQENQILTNGGSYIYLLTILSDQAYMLAWDGLKWSAPQLQNTLTSFIDPDTFRPIRMGCRQAVLLADNTLHVVGCDRGDGGDIWSTSRALNNTADWFTNAPVWSAPRTVAESTLPIRRPVLEADTEGRIHAVWGQPASGLPSGPATALYYARYEDGQWSTPQVVQSATEGVVEAPALAVDRMARLLVVWSGGESGEIYFSYVDQARGAIASAWSQPVQLPAPRRAGSSPDILVTPEGAIYVAYALPLNEGRGIYLIHSEDGGETWSAPSLVFDAAAAEWAMVDNPRIAYTSNGHLHVLWTRRSLTVDAGGMGLYYARSADGGATWSQAEVITDKPVFWSHLAGLGDRTVHRLWQEMSNGQVNLWHEVSLDSGVNWNRISPVSIFGETVGPPALTQDLAGRLHLLQVLKRGLGLYSLQHWIWDGQSWGSAQSLEVMNGALSRIGGLAAAVSPSGQFAVVYGAEVLEADGGNVNQALFFANRPLELPAGAPTPLPPLTRTPALVPTKTPTPAASPTPPVVLPENGGQTGLSLGEDPSNNVWLGSLIGPIAAGLIVLVVFVVTLRGVGAGRR